MIKNFTIQNGSGNGEIDSTNTYGGYGGGIMVGGYEMSKLHNLMIKNCSVTSGPWGAKGGGIYSESSSLSILNMLLSDNSSSEMEEVFILRLMKINININSTLIQNNNSSEKGGGILIAGGIIDISNSEMILITHLVLVEAYILQMVQ